MRGHRDLELTAAAAFACAVLGLLLPVDWLSLLVMLPLFFLLPGYALASIVVARRPAGAAQLLALTLGLSLVVLTLGSILLNYLPGGLRAVPWAILLVLVTVLACRQAAVRRERDYKPTLPERRRLRPSPSAAALTVAGAALASAAIAAAFITFKAPGAVGYTELWMRPVGSSPALRIGVGSQEQERTAYRLEVEARRSGKSTSRRLSLDPGETKVFRIAAPGAAPGKPERVVALLFRSGESGHPCRRVNAWVGGEGGGG